jgi:hypothetical protein
MHLLYMNCGVDAASIAAAPGAKLGCPRTLYAGTPGR